MTTHSNFYVLNNGIQMPKIGFGIDCLKGEEVINSVCEAIKIGYRMFDTAHLYKNEKELGIAIQKCISEGLVKREDLFIISKAPWFYPGYKETLDSYQKSLNNLQLDYLDMFLLHHPYKDSFTWQKDIRESYRALEQLYYNKQVRSIGVCNFTNESYDFLINGTEILPAINQLEFHPQYKHWHDKEICNNNGILIMAWSALNKGKIVQLPEIKYLANKYNKTPAQIALRWNIENNNAILTRSIKPERIKESFDIFDFKLTKEDIEILNNIKNNAKIDIYDKNSRPIGMMSDKNFKNLIQQKEIDILNFKLFGFIPFLKLKKINNRISKLYLFGITILKIDKQHHKERLIK